MEQGAETKATHRIVIQHPSLVEQVYTGKGS